MSTRTHRSIHSQSWKLVPENRK